AIVYTLSCASKNFELEFKKVADNWALAAFTVNAVEALPKVGDDSNAAPSAVPETVQNENPLKTAPNPALSQNNAKADPLSGLSPEKAGSHLPATANSGSEVSKSSIWLDDEPNKPIAATSKPPVAVLPPALKNAEQIKNSAEKEKKARQEREKLERERAEKEKSDNEKSAAADQSKSARIADNLGTASVRLRSGPGLNKQTLDEIPKGTKITILGESNGWYKVRYASKVGYVFAPLVDTGNSAQNSALTASTESSSGSRKKAQADEKAPSKTAVSDGDTPVVRAMTVRDERRRAISSVRVGEKVRVLSALKNNRYLIRRADGTTGYVHKDALDVKVETPPEFVP
ncbi:MAG: SH3 domain-containing protein, partial [Candidatus Obscuribacterales bacterium]|nr:SH3 domain-containing protein [Candidatus Obscuribacterales bacterium]